MTDNRTELHKLLEERGLGYQTNYLHTSWRVGPSLYDAVDNFDGTLTVDNLTPEQAIAATLVSGTCHIVKTWSDSDYVDDWHYRCSECGCNIPVNERDPDTGDVINAANYCPNCGRKVVDA